MTQPFIGQIMIFGFTFAPRNYAFCNGQLQSISQNTALFSILGTTYGGDGVTTFALPNIQERGVMNWGQGPGLTNRVLGEVDGVTTVTLTSNQMPQHTHVLFGATGGTPSGPPTTDAYFGASGPGQAYTDVLTNPVVMEPRTVSTAGSSQAHDNMQPFLVMNFCIALFGIFPSRN
ncbi:MAG: tail fiber protein [Sphingomonas sp.]